MNPVPRRNLSVEAPLAIVVLASLSLPARSDDGLYITGSWAYRGPHGPARTRPRPP